MSDPEIALPPDHGLSAVRALLHETVIDGNWSRYTDLVERLVALWPTAPSFQSRVKPWLDVCFGQAVEADVVERNHRFVEEALELVQAAGCTRSEAHQLVDYVFDRPVGDLRQEVGGVMVTLAALCLAHGLGMADEGERELARICRPEMVAKIRAKQAAKSKHSPLPGPSVSDAVDGAGWLPISTAPKDGSVFLAVTTEAQHPKAAICWWDEGWGSTSKPETFVINPHRWWPTHWMPLPAPPAPGAA